MVSREFKEFQKETRVIANIIENSILLAFAIITPLIQLNLQNAS